MARIGEVSRHAVDNVHGTRALWVDRELQRDREGAVTHHRPERVGDLRVGHDVRQEKSSRSSVDFAEGSVRPKPWQQLDAGDVPPEPLRSHPKVKPHRWGHSGRYVTSGVRKPMEHNGRCVDIGEDPGRISELQLRWSWSSLCSFDGQKQTQVFLSENGRS